MSAVSLDEIEQRAAGWILQRDAADFSESDRAALEAWLAEDARHRQAYLNLDEAWDVTAGLKQWDARNGRIDPDLLVGLADTQRPKRAWAWSLAAAALVLIVGGLGWIEFSKWRGAGYSTPVGGYERITLEDGSVLQLNTDTAVRTQLTESRRVVRLLRGEVYFDVAQDSQRPFEVVVGKTVARALGTAFSVRVGAGEQLELMVTQGRVLLLPGGPTKLIAAGQSVRASAEKIAVAPVAHEEIARRLAWQSGQLVFDRQPLSQVAEELNRYNRRQVRIETASLESLELTGNFKATDLDSFVAAVKSAMNVQVDQTPDAVVIRSP